MKRTSCYMQHMKGFDAEQIATQKVYDSIVITY